MRVWAKNQVRWEIFRNLFGFSSENLNGKLSFSHFCHIFCNFPGRSSLYSAGKWEHLSTTIFSVSAKRSVCSDWLRHWRCRWESVVPAENFMTRINQWSTGSVFSTSHRLSQTLRINENFSNIFSNASFSTVSPFFLANFLFSWLQAQLRILFPPS